MEYVKSIGMILLAGVLMELCAAFNLPILIMVLFMLGAAGCLAYGILKIYGLYNLRCPKCKKWGAMDEMGSNVYQCRYCGCKVKREE